MCGIAGYLAINPELSENAPIVVYRMLKQLHHRGPDQSGVGDYSGFSMGMNRLCIIDMVHHTIPYADESGRWFGVYNGEIYNHRELRQQLSEHYRFKSGSDAETALYGYIDRGVRSFTEYNGMFAIAIWDNDNGKLVLVRDKVGEKPLYYISRPDFFAFASEMKAFSALMKLQENLTVGYRTFEFSVGEETMFSEIKQLGPGEYIEIDRSGNLTIKDYWKIWNNLIEVPDDLDKIEKQLTELLEDAILLRTRNCAHPFAIFTGGGVDSALMACVSRPDRLYYCHYDVGKAFDELDYAKLLADKINRKLEIIEPSKEDFLRIREKLAWHLDSPCTWTSFSLWMLLEGLHPEIKMVMTGEGADEAFAGYHRYHLLHHDEQIHKLEAMKEYDYLISKYYGSPVDRYLKLVNRCDNIYDAEVNEYLQKEIAFYFSRLGDDVVHGMGLFDFYTTMQVLLQMSDRVNMAFSVENRSPYLDHRLLQYAFSMSSKYKIRDGVTKWILKRIARKFIPHEIADRVDKRGFSAPVNIWFGWEAVGKYNRSIYRDMVYQDWKKVFGLSAEVSD